MSGLCSVLHTHKKGLIISNALTQTQIGPHHQQCLDTDIASSITLKGHQSEEANYHEKHKMCKQSHLQAFFGCSLSIYAKQNIFLTSNLSSSGCSHVGLFFTAEGKRKLAHDKLDTCAAHVGTAHDVTDTDCLPQNGSTHSRVFATLRPDTIAQKNFFFNII